MNARPGTGRFAAPALAAADAELARRLLAGDEEAVAEVRRWVRGAAGPYRRLLAAELEDLEQEVLVELTQTLRDGRFRGESRLATYVRRTVHYEAIDRMRARRRRTWVDIADLELPAASDSPFDRLVAEDSRAVSLRVAARMPSDCRRLWRMLLAGLGYGEMSRQLGVSTGALRVRVLRCRRRAVAELEKVTGRSAGSAEE